MVIVAWEIIVQIPTATCSEANLNHSEIWNFKIFQTTVSDESEDNLKPIWNLKVQSEIWRINLNHYEIWSFYDFSDFQSEKNLKAIWIQFEIWKSNSKAATCISTFILVARLSTSILAAYSLADHRSASNCLFLPTVIASSLAWCLALTIIYLILVSILIELLLLIYNHFF